MTKDTPESRWFRQRVYRLSLLLLLTVATFVVNLSVERMAGGAIVAPDAPRPSAPSGAGLNVFLVSIDTLRSDRLGSYGSTRGLTPRLDAFAAESVRFQRTVSQAPWTIPSHMTLFTSLFPSAHGVNRGFREFEADPEARHSFRPLRPDATTLAERLRAAGYRTLALTGGGTMTSGFGFERGFDEYRIGDAELTDDVARQLWSWFDQPSDRPFFVFLHTFEVHAPYDESELAADELTSEQLRAMNELFARSPERPLEAQQEFLRSNGLFRPDVTSALYDGGIAVVDDFLGRLFERMRARGLLDRTLVVFTSDHGEEFADHDPQRFYDCHCAPMYRELTRVPLIVRFPPLASRGLVVDRFVGLVDVAPTILDLLDLPIPAAFQGRSLEPLLAGGDVGPPWILSEAACIGPEIKALRVGNYKYIASFELGPDGDRSRPIWPPVREELYDRTNDRMERVDLSRQRPDVTARMRALLAKRLDAVAHRGETLAVEQRLDAETARRLRSLGYL